MVAVDFQYDFHLEEQVIAWSESQRQVEIEQDRAQTERVADTIEQFTQVTSSESNSESPPEEVASEEPAGPQVAAPTGPSTQPFLSSDILMPTIMPAASTEKDRPEVRRSPSSFDIADFETVQDPFESMELKVLNDREELNKMLSCAQPSGPVVGAEGVVGGEVAVGETSNCQTVGGGGGTDTAPGTAGGNVNGLHSTVSAGGMPNGMSTSGLNGPSVSPVGAVNGTPAGAGYVPPVVTSSVMAGYMAPAGMASSAVTGYIPPSVTTSPVGAYVPPAVTSSPAHRSLQDIDYPDMESLSSSPPVAISGSSVHYQPHQPSSAAFPPASGQYYPSSTQAGYTGGGYPAARLPPLPASSSYLVSGQQGYPMYSQAASHPQAAMATATSAQPAPPSYSQAASHHAPAMATSIPQHKPWTAYSTPTNGTGLPPVASQPSLTTTSTGPAYPLRPSRSTPDLAQAEGTENRPTVPTSHTPPPSCSRSRPNTPPAPERQVSIITYSGDPL